MIKPPPFLEDEKGFLNLGRSRNENKKTHNERERQSMSMSELRREIEQSCKIGVVLSKRWPKDPDDCWHHRVGKYSFDQPKAGDKGHKIVRIEVSYDIITEPVRFHKKRG